MSHKSRSQMHLLFFSLIHLSFDVPVLLHLARPESRVLWEATGPKAACPSDSARLRDLRQSQQSPPFSRRSSVLKHKASSGPLTHLAHLFLPCAPCADITVFL